MLLATTQFPRSIPIIETELAPASAEQTSADNDVRKPNHVCLCETCCRRPIDVVPGLLSPPGQFIRQLGYRAHVAQRRAERASWFRRPRQMGQPTAECSRQSAAAAAAMPVHASAGASSGADDALGTGGIAVAAQGRTAVAPVTPAQLPEPRLNGPMPSIQQLGYAAAAASAASPWSQPPFTGPPTPLLAPPGLPFPPRPPVPVPFLPPWLDRPGGAGAGAPVPLRRPAGYPPPPFPPPPYLPPSVPLSPLDETWDDADWDGLAAAAAAAAHARADLRANAEELGVTEFTAVPFGGASSPSTLGRRQHEVIVKSLTEIRICTERIGRILRRLPFASFQAALLNAVRGSDVDGRGGGGGARAAAAPPSAARTSAAAAAASQSIFAGSVQAPGALGLRSRTLLLLHCHAMQAVWQEKVPLWNKSQVPGAGAAAAAALGEVVTEGRRLSALLADGLLSYHGLPRGLPYEELTGIAEVLARLMEDGFAMRRKARLGSTAGASPDAAAAAAAAVGTAGAAAAAGASGVAPPGDCPGCCLSIEAAVRLATLSQRVVHQVLVDYRRAAAKAAAEAQAEAGANGSSSAGGRGSGGPGKGAECRPAAGPKPKLEAAAAAARAAPDGKQASAGVAATDGPDQKIELAWQKLKLPLVLHVREVAARTHLQLLQQAAAAVAAASESAQADGRCGEAAGPAPSDGESQRHATQAGSQGADGSGGGGGGADGSVLSSFRLHYEAAAAAAAQEHRERVQQRERLMESQRRQQQRGAQRRRGGGAGEAPGAAAGGGSDQAELLAHLDMPHLEALLALRLTQLLPAAVPWGADGRGADDGGVSGGAAATSGDSSLCAVAGGGATFNSARTRTLTLRPEVLGDRAKMAAAAAGADAAAPAAPAAAGLGPGPCADPCTQRTDLARMLLGAHEDGLPARLTALSAAPLQLALGAAAALLQAADSHRRFLSLWIQPHDARRGLLGRGPLTSTKQRFPLVLRVRPPQPPQLPDSGSHPQPHPPSPSPSQLGPQPSSQRHPQSQSTSLSTPPSHGQLRSSGARHNGVAESAAMAETALGAEAGAEAGAVAGAVAEAHAEAGMEAGTKAESGPGPEAEAGAVELDVLPGSPVLDRRIRRALRLLNGPTAASGGGGRAVSAGRSIGNGGGAGRGGSGAADDGSGDAGRDRGGGGVSLDAHLASELRSRGCAALRCPGRASLQEVVQAVALAQADAEARGRCLLLLPQLLDQDATDLVRQAGHRAVSQYLCIEERQVPPPMPRPYESSSDEDEDEEGPDGGGGGGGGAGGGGAGGSGERRGADGAAATPPGAALEGLVAEAGCRRILLGNGVLIARQAGWRHVRRVMLCRVMSELLCLAPPHVSLLAARLPLYDSGGDGGFAGGSEEARRAEAVRAEVAKRRVQRECVAMNVLFLAPDTEMRVFVVEVGAEALLGMAGGDWQGSAS